MKKVQTNTLRTLICASLAALSLTAVSAVDFGGSVNNDTKFAGQKTSDLKCDQKDIASLWFRAPLTKDGSCYLAAEALYQYEKDFAVPTTTNAVDCDLFKIGWSRKDRLNKMTVSAGRFASLDLTGLIFNQLADGVLFRYDMPRLSVTAYGGYTGFLNAQTVTILAPEQDPFTYDTDKIYPLAAKYGLASLSVSCPNLFLNQTLAAQFFSTFRVEGDKYNRLYGTLSLNGPIVPSLFYTLTSTAGMTSYDGASYDISNLSTASISFYPSAITSSISLNGVYASGEQGPFKKFTGFTSQTATNAYDGQQYSGMAKCGLTGTIKPVKALLLSAGADIVFDADDSVEYGGFQYKAGATWQILSDVQAGASMYQYTDKDDPDNRNKTCFELTAIVTF